MTVVEPLIGGSPVSAFDPPRDATHELALGGDVTRSALGESDWWARHAARASTRSAPTWTPPPTPSRPRRATCCSRFGRGHGDWTPWNMRRVDGRLVVWDWERSRDGVPVGLDALHYGLLVALNARKLPPPRAVADTLERAPGVAATTSTSRPRSARVMLCLELLEMSLRYAEARRAGVTRAPRPLRHRAAPDCSMYRAAERTGTMR